MPLKKKKGKVKKGKGGKGKGKGKKGKGKKGKKGSDPEKLDKEKLMKEALANAQIWEHKFHAIDKSRLEYRENAVKLISENESLQKSVNQTERDTIEVIAYLKKEDAEKEQELDRLRQEVKDLRVEATKERESLITEYSRKIDLREKELQDKEEEVRIIQGELRAMKEFRKRKLEMQGQLEQLQTTIEDMNEDHKKTLSNMEQKFFEEKLRLQKEANRRIEKLAGTAHDEAISNLDERTREVYRENIRMANALKIHIEHEEELQKSQTKLEMTNRQLVAEKELNQKLVKDKIKQSSRHKKQIKDLQGKVVQLEQSLTVLVQEFQQERQSLEQSYTTRHAHLEVELQGLQRRSELQDRETTHVKKLARKILDQRTELEEFFLEALAHVRKEIEINRSEYRDYAKMMYQQRMTAACKGAGGYPSVRTFKPGQDASTNSVYQDMAIASSWDHVGKDGESVSISDMTWEQKEQVLRLLFAKMNGSSTSPPQPRSTLPPITAPAFPGKPALPPITEPSSKPQETPVFLTQSSHHGGQDFKSVLLRQSVS